MMSRGVHSGLEGHSRQRGRSCHWSTLVGEDLHIIKRSRGNLHLIFRRAGLARAGVARTEQLAMSSEDELATFKKLQR